MYRHREHGYLLDPGGFWLGSDMATVLGDLDKVKWFAANFKKLGRIKVEDALANFERIISLLRTRVGAEVLVANALVVDPGITTFDYRLSHSPHTSRRREFVLGLIDLSRKLDFPVLDIDSLTKRDGVSGMGDCERIARTPVPFAYAHHIKAFLFIFCLTAPMALLQSMGWATPLATAVIVYGLYGIDEIGVEIEDPFGHDPNDLPLDEIGEMIERDVAETFAIRQSASGSSASSSARATS